METRVVTFEPLDLQPWRNNVGITTAANLAAGRATVGASSAKL